MVPNDAYKESRESCVSGTAETGCVKEGFLVDIPEWVGIGQLKKNEAFQERD